MMDRLVVEQGAAELLSHDKAVFKVLASTARQMSKGSRYRHDEVAVMDVSGARDLADWLVGLDITELSKTIAVGLAQLAADCNSTTCFDFADCVDSASERIFGADVPFPNQPKVVAVAKPSFR